MCCSCTTSYVPTSFTVSSASVLIPQNKPPSDLSHSASFVRQHPAPACPWPANFQLQIPVSIGALLIDQGFQVPCLEYNITSYIMAYTTPSTSIARILSLISYVGGLRSGGFQDLPSPHKSMGTYLGRYGVFLRRI